MNDIASLFPFVGKAEAEGVRWDLPAVAEEDVERHLDRWYREQHRLLNLMRTGMGKERKRKRAGQDAWESGLPRKAGKRERGDLVMSGALR